MHGFVLLLLLFTSSITSAEVLHESLPSYNNPSDITLYDHERFRSSVPEHNIVPPHGRKENDKYVNHLNMCGGYSTTTICGETNFLGTDLHITFYKSEKPIAKTTLEGKFGYGFFRLIGAPSAKLYASIYFSEDKIGLLSSFGFTLIRKNMFCKTITLASNDEFSFGLTKDNQVVLIGNGSPHSGSSRVDGWRVYDEKVLCP